MTMYLFGWLLKFVLSLVSSMCVLPGFVLNLIATFVNHHYYY